MTVRVKGGKSLRNGMWNDVRNGIIMRSTIYAGNKLTKERILFSRQFYKSSSFFDVADNQTTDRGLENIRLGKNTSDRWLGGDSEEIDEVSHSRN